MCVASTAFCVPTAMLKIGVTVIGVWLALGAKASLQACGDESRGGVLSPKVRCVAYSPDGRSLAIAGNEDDRGLMVIWNLKELKPRFRRREPAGCSFVAFSPDGGTIALVRDSTDVLLLDARSGAPLKSLTGHRAKILCLAFSPDGRKLITGSTDWTARIWDVATGSADDMLLGHAGAISSVDVTRDGRLLATTDGRAGTVRLWDLKSRLVLNSFDQPSMFVPHVRFSPDGRLLAVSCSRGTLSLLDTTTSRIRMHFQNNHGIKSSDFSPDQKWLAIATSSPVIDVRRLMVDVDEATKARIARLISKLDDDSYADREKASRELASLAMAAEPQLQEGTKAQSAEVRVRCRNLLARLSQPGPGVRLEGHAGEVACVCFSPDGQHLASGDDRGEVRLWRVGDWKTEVSMPITGATARRK
jgi:WD40 repeat protein